MATVITGDGGNNTLPGTTGNDSMFGFGGSDVLVSSPGYDTMSGGLDADKFDFNSTSEAYYDRVADFAWWEGDKIDVSTIDAKADSWSSPSTWGNNTFAFKGNVAGAGLGRGELGYTHVNGDTMVYGNTDSDGTYEFAIRVTGYHYLIGSDFVL